MATVNSRWLEPQPGLEYNPDCRPPVHAIDHLAARWMASLPTKSKGTVFSPVGIWPLLAILADVASPRGRSRLEKALGLTVPQYGTKGVDSNTESFTDMAQAVIRSLDRSVSTSAALGLWVSRKLELRDEWVAALPAATIQVLTGDEGRDAEAVTQWAREKTRGVIPDLSIEPSLDARVLLASAVTMRTKWEDPFSRNRKTGRLERTTRAPRIVRTGPNVTTVRIRGEVEPMDGVEELHDVYLVLGQPSVSAGTTLALGLEEIRGLGGAKDLTQENAEEIAKSKGLGPGIDVRIEHKIGNKPSSPFVHVHLPSFEVEDRTNLVSEVFGLGLHNNSLNQFPGIASNLPLAIRDGHQTARAGFDEEGFQAAAFTDFGPIVTAGRPRPVLHKVVHITATFDRPFGFLVVDAKTQLLLFAGWVTEKDWTGVKDRRLARPFARLQRNTR